jgi:hypothetical protein
MHLLAHLNPSSPQRSRRKVLVLINPHSGPGRALEIHETRVAPILEEANCDIELMITRELGTFFVISKDYENYVDYK